MAKDLTASNVHRKNILNNKYALQEIEKEVAFQGILFEGSLRYTKRQIAQFYGIDERTIERYLEQHEDEFKENGYEVLRGKKLNDFKQAYEQYIGDLHDGKGTNAPNINDGSDTNVGTIADADVTGTDVANIDESIKKTSVLGVLASA